MCSTRLELDVAAGKGVHLLSKWRAWPKIGLQMLLLNSQSILWEHGSAMTYLTISSGSLCGLSLYEFSTPWGHLHKAIPSIFVVDS